MEVINRGTSKLDPASAVTFVGLTKVTATAPKLAVHAICTGEVSSDDANNRVARGWGPLPNCGAVYRTRTDALLGCRGDRARTRLGRDHFPRPNGVKAGWEIDGKELRRRGTWCITRRKCHDQFGNLHRVNRNPESPVACILAETVHAVVPTRATAETLEAPGYDEAHVE
jgi:hypothetical protein